MKLAISIDEASKSIGLGRSTIYDLINSGKLKSLKIGSRRIISIESLNEFLRSSFGGDE